MNEQETDATRANEEKEKVRDQATRERWRLLIQIERLLEVPMVVLGFVWLGLLIVELWVGLSKLLQGMVTAIWIIFILDFVVKLVIAPQKRRFLTRNWLTIIALVVPALRVARIGSALRFLRLSRATGSFRLVRVIGSMNRGLKTLRRTMRRRSFGYVLLATIMVAIVGALAIRALEGGASGTFSHFGSALWWTLMILITLPTGTWPETPEGRALTFFLSLYGFAMFGYITAMLASWFVGQDEEENKREKEILRIVRALEEEVVALRAEVARDGS